MRQSSSSDSSSLAGAAVGASANFANPNIAHELPTRMEKLNLEASSKSQQVMQDNLRDFGTGRTAAIVGNKVDPKVEENMCNNEKPLDARTFLGRSPQKKYPSMNIIFLYNSQSN